MSAVLRKLISDDRWRCGLLCAALFALLWPGLSDYVSLKWGMRYFWLLLLPVIIHVRAARQRSLRYLFAVLPLVALSLWQPHPLFRFFLLWATLFLLVESSIGRLDRLAPLFAVLVAPITHYFFNNFGFGVRLGISDAVAASLRLVDPHASAIGNAVLFHGGEFHVDPDCMGLRMITTSLLVTMALIALLERRRRVMLPFHALPALLALALLLVVGSNYLRVLALVVSGAPAGGIWHEAIGLICWIVILLLPMAWIVDRWTLLRGRQTREPPPAPAPSADLRPLWARWAATGVLVPVMIAGFAHPHVPMEQERDLLAEQLVLPGCRPTVLPNHVVRFDGEGALVYIKPGKPFYSDDHHPMSCWLGSGFSFTHEVVEAFQDGEICRGLLVNGTHKRYTAWWYDNGRVRTTGQLEWRWLAAQGEGPFRLVNVTADSPQQLMQLVTVAFKALSSPPAGAGIPRAV